MRKEIIVIIVIIFLFVINYSGCIDDKKSNQNDEDENLKLYISTDKNVYNLGENVSISIKIENNQDIDIKDNLSISILGLYASLEQIPIYTNNSNIFILANSNISKTIVLKQEDYINNVNCSIQIHTSNTKKSLFFEVIGGLNINVISPENVKQNQEFNVTLDIENIVEFAIEEINVSALFGYFSNVSGMPEEIQIPILNSGKINSTTWNVKIPKGDLLTISFIVKSQRGDYYRIDTAVKAIND